MDKSTGSPKRSPLVYPDVFLTGENVPGFEQRHQSSCVISLVDLLNHELPATNLLFTQLAISAVLYFTDKLERESYAMELNGALRELGPEPGGSPDQEAVDANAVLPGQ